MMVHASGCGPNIPTHVWAYDCVEGRTHDGRKRRILTIIDEASRECVMRIVATQLQREDVLSALADLYGPPNSPRSSALAANVDILREAHRLVRNFSHSPTPITVRAKRALKAEPRNVEPVIGKLTFGALDRGRQRAEMRDYWPEARTERMLQLAPAEPAASNDCTADRLRQVYRHLEIGRELEQLELNTLLAAEAILGERDERIGFLKVFDALHHFSDAVIGDLGNPP